MAKTKKMTLDIKKVITLVGRLDKNEEGQYIVTVEDKDNVETYLLDNILQDMEGQVISLTSDIY